MGLGTERHDTMSQETHAAQWLGFRQPVLRVAREKRGERINATYEANPGEVWEESEFWAALTWRIDPDGALGIRQHFESPYRPGQPVTMDEYYGWMFENSVPGLPETAAPGELTPLAYMRRYGVFKVKDNIYAPYKAALDADALAGATLDRDSEHVLKDGKPIGVIVDGAPLAGFSTPSRRLEFYSQTLVDWGWPEHAVPRYVPGHVHWRDMQRDDGEFDLLPNFRLPTLIHTRSPVKWLYEISHDNPLWIATADARALRRRDRRSGQGADADRILRHARLGHRRHPAGRARHVASPGPLASARGDGQSQRLGARHHRSARHGLQGVAGARRAAVREHADPDSSRIWWSEVGVHQNLTFPVQPDPVSGMHCWHQRVTLEKAGPGDHYGDIFVDTAKAHDVYKEWIAMTRPAPGPGGLRRPLWFDRPLRPIADAYKV